MDTPTLREIKQTTEKLSNSKVAGYDGIPAKLWKSGGNHLLEWLHEFLTLCWEEGKIPQDFKDATIIPIYKNKGNKTDCNNNSGITLLSITAKTLAKILLSRLVANITEKAHQRNQCGFRKNRNTNDMVFVL